MQVHRLESRWPALSCLATQQTGHPLVHGRRLRRLIAEIAPDVIHLWRHARELCDGRECVRCQLHYRRPPQLWRWSGLLQAKSRHVDVFLAPSRFSQHKHREFGFSREMEVLPHFLPDTEEEAPAPGDILPPTRPYFLFAGRLEEIKGLQDVIPLFKEDSPAELWVAGQGSYEPMLRRLAQGRSGVRFLGQLSAATLRSLYAEACAVVAPSRCFEVFPMILLEAFREGTPVIARRLGPYPEVVEETGAGLLFRSPSELRLALEGLAADPVLRNRLGAAGRRALQRRWSEEVVINQYLQLVERVARERGRDQTVRILEAAR